MRIEVRKGESRTEALDKAFKQKINEIKEKCGLNILNGEWFIVRFYSKEMDKSLDEWMATNLIWQYNVENPFIDADPDDLFEDWIGWVFDLNGMINVDEIHDMPIKL